MSERGRPKMIPKMPKEKKSKFPKTKENGQKTRKKLNFELFEKLKKTIPKNNPVKTNSLGHPKPPRRRWCTEGASQDPPTWLSTERVGRVLPKRQRMELPPPESNAQKYIKKLLLDFSSKLSIKNARAN